MGEVVRDGKTLSLQVNLNAISVFLMNPGVRYDVHNRRTFLNPALEVWAFTLLPVMLQNVVSILMGFWNNCRPFATKLSIQ